MNKKSKSQFFLYILIIILFSACSADKFSEDSIYNNLEADKELIVDPSLIQTGVKVELKDLENKINTDLGGVLIEDKDFKKWGRYYVKSKITSRGDIKLSSNSDELIFAVPAHFEGIVKVNETFLGVKIQAQPKFQLDCDITLAASIGIDEELKPLIKSRIINIKWPNPPGINAGPIRIDLSEALEMIIKENESRISGIVASKAKKSFDLKKEIKNLDIEIETQEEIEIDDLTYFLSLVPQKVLIGNKIQFDQKYAMVNAGVMASFQINQLELKDSKININELDIQAEEFQSNALEVNVKLAMTYMDISNLIMDKLKQSDVQINSENLVVNNVRCGKLNNNRLWIFLELEAGMKAEVFAHGTIEYDSIDKSIIISDLEKQFYTGNALSDFLLRFAPIETDKIENRLNRIDLKPLYQKIDEKISTQISQLSLSQDMEIQLVNLDFNISEFNLKKDEIELIAGLTGESNLKIKLKQ